MELKFMEVRLTSIACFVALGLLAACSKSGDEASAPVSEPGSSTLESKADYVLPAPEMTFFHRKLMGTFMILARLQAQINVQDLIQPYLPRLQAT